MKVNIVQFADLFSSIYLIYSTALQAKLSLYKSFISDLRNCQRLKFVRRVLFSLSHFSLHIGPNT